ncbi:MAG: VOC family protein [Alphaproteobacteria bacterium]|nr:VOC family protein [Alphaproteobacteria bacterium]
MTSTTNTPPPFSILGLDHVVLRVGDVSASKAFYCGILGCTLERSVDSIGLVQLRAGASLIDLIDANTALSKQGSPAPDAAGINMDHFCIRIEPFDPKAIQDSLEKNGLAYSETARRYGADGYGPSVYISDPDGNTVELKGPPDGANV